MKGLRLMLPDASILEPLGRMERTTVALRAADCAERVLPLFECEHPGDTRPRAAIEAARAWARGELRVGEARRAALAAHAAAREARSEPARAAARACGHAAATAHVATHAVAVLSYAANAAGHAAHDSEYQWQRTHLLGE